MGLGRVNPLRRRWVVFAGVAFLVSTEGLRMAASAGRAKIVVDHPAALMDAEISIELQGFPSGQPVTIAATQVYPSGSRWRAGATFITDDTGSAYIAHQAPVSGTYDGESAMGLIWSAERVPAGATSFPDGWIMQPWYVHLEASAPDGTRAELILERRAVGPGVTRWPIRNDGLVGTLFLPPGGGPHAGVLVLGGGGGGIDEFRGAMLASHGYAALNLGYFGMSGLPRGLVNIPLEYFEQAIVWMRAQPWLRDRFLAVWGESRGGELALLLGPRSMPLRRGSQAGWSSGRWGSLSQAICAHAHHGHSGANRFRTCKRTTRRLVPPPRRNRDAPLHTRRSTSVISKTSRPSSAQPFRSRK